MSIFIERMIRAAKLDVNLYEKATRLRGGTGQHSQCFQVCIVIRWKQVKRD